MLFNKPYSQNAGEKEWLEHRKKFITATEAGALMGVNPYMTPSKLLKDKPKAPTKLVSEFLDRGLENEESVLLVAEEWLQGELMDEYRDPNNRMFYADEDTRISATPDGMMKDGRMIEIKCTGAKNLSNWEHPPLYYIMQCQVQMYVTGAVENYLMARFFYHWPTTSCEPAADKMWKIDYNPEIIKILVDKVKEFWYALDNGSTIRLKKSDTEKHSDMLRLTCSEYRGNIIMQKFEIEPMQLKIVRQTCLKAAAKMMPLGTTEFAKGSVELAKMIEEDIFFAIGEACNDGGRNFMIQIGAAVNGFVEARPTGSIKEMKEFVIEGLRYLAKE